MGRALSGGQGQGKGDGQGGRRERGSGRLMLPLLCLPPSPHCKKLFWAIFQMRKDLLAICLILLRVQISRNPQLGCQGLRIAGGEQICACGQLLYRAGEGKVSSLRTSGLC